MNSTILHFAIYGTSNVVKTLWDHKADPYQLSGPMRASVKGLSEEALFLSLWAATADGLPQNLCRNSTTGSFRL